MQIDAATLRRLWPRAPQALVDAMAAKSAAVFAKHGLTTSLRVAHFMAQISHESNGGTITTENLSYSHAERIAAVWPSRFTPASAAPYVHNPRALADKVYNGRMGNAPGSDDGYSYRGRGLLQITGRESYRRIGGLTGLPLEARPDLAAAPSVALEIAAAEFKSLGCLPYCDADNVMAVTRRVNGGYTGLASRKAWLEKWKAAKFDEQPAETDAEPADPAGTDPEPPPVEIPRGSDETLPPAVDDTKDKSPWAAIIGTITAIGTALGQAVDGLRPLLTDPRTIIAVAAIIGIAGLVILYESHKRAKTNHV